LRIPVNVTITVYCLHSWIKYLTPITYDGLYGDWNKYPHTTIQYATPGTHEHVADASAAIYCDGTQLFGHVETPMQAHLTEAGGELTQAITIKFNDNWSQVFYPRMETVDSLLLLILKVYTATLL